MTASAEIELQALLHDAKQAREDLQGATDRERYATVTFMDRALALRWSWEAIGQMLGVSGTGARRYYNRNRKRVRSGE